MDAPPTIKPPASLGALRFVCSAIKVLGFASLVALPFMFIVNGYGSSIPSGALGIMGFGVGLVFLVLSFAAAGSIEVFLSMEESLRALRSIAEKLPRSDA